LRWQVRRYAFLRRHPLALVARRGDFDPSVDDSCFEHRNGVGCRTLHRLAGFWMGGFGKRTMPFSTLNKMVSYDIMKLPVPASIIFRRSSTRAFRWWGAPDSTG
jgi:hypothetical protein